MNSEAFQRSAQLQWLIKVFDVSSCRKVYFLLAEISIFFIETIKSISRTQSARSTVLYSSYEGVSKSFEPQAFSPFR